MAFSLGTPSAATPADAPSLLATLAQQPQPAVVWYGGDDQRVELSGAVLANWAHKLINLFREEYDLGAGQSALIDMACHWKAAAAALAVYAVGSEVRLSPGTGPMPEVAVDLVITDRPDQWAPAGAPAAALRGADLAALSHGLLDTSFSDTSAVTVPSWALDVSAEVRQQPDQVVEPLPAIPLPAPSPALPAASSEAAILTQWGSDSVAQLLQRWSARETVVLCHSEASESLRDLIRRNEGLHR